jgi:lipopolysaccharide assembly outer membrane protein LptD (OstA)
VRYRLCGVLCILVLFFTLPTLWAEEKREVSFFADQTEVSFQNGILIKKYTGNVTATCEDMTLSAEKAVYYKIEEKIELVGNVCVSDTSKSIEADSITYWVEERKATAIGRVLVQRKGQRLNSDRAVYLEIENRIIALGNVRLVDLPEQITVTGGRAEYNLETEVSVITDHPRFVKTEKQEDENLIVTARQMELRNKEKRVIATQDVQLNKKRTIAVCGQMIYLQPEEKLILQDNPQVVQLQPEGAEQTLKGDTIEIALKERVINEVTVTGEATGRTVEKDGEEVSQISGQQISLKFEDEQLQRIVVEGNATSVYYLFKPEDSQREINEASGDRVEFFFREGEFYRVLVTGGAVGTYSSASNF